MSFQANRIVKVAQHLHFCMSNPRRTVQDDLHIFDVDLVLRAYAIEYIDQACQDLDCAARLSKAVAAGRAERAPKARSAARPAVPGGLTCK